MTSGLAGFVVWRASLRVSARGRARQLSQLLGKLLAWRCTVMLVCAACALQGLYAEVRQLYMLLDVDCAGRGWPGSSRTLWAELDSPSHMAAGLSGACRHVRRAPDSLFAAQAARCVVFASALSAEWSVK